VYQLVPDDPLALGDRLTHGIEGAGDASDFMGARRGHRR
jgi:hypothetical protein